MSDGTRKLDGADTACAPIVLPCTGPVPIHARARKVMIHLAERVLPGGNSVDTQRLWR